MLSGRLGNGFAIDASDVLWCVIAPATLFFDCLLTVFVFCEGLLADMARMRITTCSTCRMSGRSTRKRRTRNSSGFARFCSDSCFKFLLFRFRARQSEAMAQRSRSLCWYARSLTCELLKRIMCADVYQSDNPRVACGARDLAGDRRQQQRVPGARLPVAGGGARRLPDHGAARGCLVGRSAAVVPARLFQSVDRRHKLHDLPGRAPRLRSIPLLSFCRREHSRLKLALLAHAKPVRQGERSYLLALLSKQRCFVPDTSARRERSILRRICAASRTTARHAAPHQRRALPAHSAHLASSRCPRRSVADSAQQAPSARPDRSRQIPVRAALEATAHLAHPLRFPALLALCTLESVLCCDRCSLAVVLRQRCRIPSARASAALATSARLAQQLRRTPLALRSAPAPRARNSSQTASACLARRVQRAALHAHVSSIICRDLD